jgi:L-lactate dehydrogenase complex protein LldG
MSSTVTDQTSNDSRTAILASIREHLAESARHEVPSAHDSAALPNSVSTNRRNGSSSAVEDFRARLESVGGHCRFVRGEAELDEVLIRIVTELRGSSSVPIRRIALSDSPLLSRLAKTAATIVDKATITPNAADLFDFDIGITTAQAGIAETGTLVLESDSERHRLISLVPPIHIAVLRASDICLTLGDALARVRKKSMAEMSRAITFITGPSRTADIELTLAIGVHGPKELFVIICQ